MDNVKYDLAIKLEERFQKVGVEMERPDGSTYVLINRDFRPDSVPKSRGFQNVLIRKFKPGRFSPIQNHPADLPRKDYGGGIFGGSIHNPIKREPVTED